MTNRIDYSFWLIFDEKGGVRMSRSEPSVGRGERAMSCTVTLPRSVFRTPTLRADIKMDDAVGQDVNIDVKAASDALKAALGVDIDLKIQASK